MSTDQNPTNSAVVASWSPTLKPLTAWCSQTGISPKTAYRQAAAGELKIVKIGRLAFISEDEDRRYAGTRKPFVSAMRRAA